MVSGSATVSSVRPVAFNVHRASHRFWSHSKEFDGRHPAPEYVIEDAPRRGPEAGMERWSNETDTPPICEVEQDDEEGSREASAREWREMSVLRRDQRRSIRHPLRLRRIDAHPCHNQTRPPSLLKCTSYCT